MASKISTAKLTYRHDLNDTLSIFRFDLAEGVPDYEPGQFITLGLPIPEDDDKVCWRAYSIASPPSRKEYLELYIRRPMSPVPGKFTSALWERSIGDEVQYRTKITGPFTLVHEWPDGRPDARRLLLIGGGTGLAPFIAMALELKARNIGRELVVMHGASYTHELGYRELLEDLERETASAGPGEFRVRYVPSISRPQEETNAGWTGETGRIETLLQVREGASVSRIEAIVGAPLTTENYFCLVCGYEGTCKSSVAVLEPKGFVQRRQAREDGTYDLKFESYG